jgi:hypothetical protein
VAGSSPLARWPDLPALRRHRPRLPPPVEARHHPIRKGTWKCRDCRKKFTVTIGTVFAETHIPLNKWLLSPITQGGPMAGGSKIAVFSLISREGEARSQVIPDLKAKTLRASSATRSRARPTS